LRKQGKSPIDLGTAIGPAGKGRQVMRIFILPEEK
jgi:hypothetical protein